MPSTSKIHTMISKSSPTVKRKDENVVVFRDYKKKPTGNNNSIINRLMGSVFSTTKKIHPEGVSSNTRSKIVPNKGGSKRRHTKNRKTIRKK